MAEEKGIQRERERKSVKYGPKMTLTCRLERALNEPVVQHWSRVVPTLLPANQRALSTRVENM